MSLKLFEKPEGGGVEMKTSADGDSSVMLRLDGMEGPAPKPSKRKD